MVLILLISGLAASAKLIYTPYYFARGSMVNGKPRWEKYQRVNSSSIVVSPAEVQLNIVGYSPLSFYGYTNKTQGKTANGEYRYYEGLLSEQGVETNIRWDFTNDGWVTISIYMPSLNGPNCMRFKCKFLTEM